MVTPAPTRSGSAPAALLGQPAWGSPRFRRRARALRRVLSVMVVMASLTTMAIAAWPAPPVDPAPEVPIPSVTSPRDPVLHETLTLGPLL